MLAETELLVRIDSGSHDAAGVDRVSAAVAAMLAAQGFELSREPLAGHGDRVAASLVRGPGPKLLIVGHADTVWPAGTVARWSPQRESAMLAGPGVGDMKGCLVMAVHALAAAQRAGRPYGVGVADDQELGSRTAHEGGRDTVAVAGERFARELESLDGEHRGDRGADPVHAGRVMRTAVDAHQQLGLREHRLRLLAQRRKQRGGAHAGGAAHGRRLR